MYGKSQRNKFTKLKISNMTTCLSQRRILTNLRQLAVLMVLFLLLMVFGYESQRSMDTRITDMLGQATQIRQQQIKLIKIHDRLMTDVNKTWTNVLSQREHIETLEQYSKRYNLRFLGVPESNDEDLIETIKQIIQETMGVTLRDTIAEAARIKNENVQPRPILVKFSKWKDKTKVLYRRKTLPESMSIEDDLTQAQRERRKKLRKIAALAEQEGKKIKWSGKQLFVDGVEMKVT
ncbi:unnamed protein product [Clavelina lepadiformis]|uniref:Uncharacterized protein n=2 Tax=Clavelina lepadiformis TaxID=159417 RepID=A0ABP0H058_CLALP